MPNDLWSLLFAKGKDYNERTKSYNERIIDSPLSVAFQFRMLAVISLAYEMNPSSYRCPFFIGCPFIRAPLFFLQLYRCLVLDL